MAMTSSTSAEDEVSLAVLESFTTFMSRRMLRVNVLMTGNAILMGVMVGIGAYGHRYRHHPLIRFFFIGATTLFLPIVSYIVSTTGVYFTVAVLSTKGLATGECRSESHMIQVMIWTAVVLIIGINTTAIVAADDREGRSIAPPVVLLVQAVWVTYLAVILTIGANDQYSSQTYRIIFFPFALIFVKIFLKYYAWYSARQSFSFGRNPRLIAGYSYMTEHLLADDSQHATDEQHVPPPLLVSRENTMEVGEHPHGYRIMSSSSSSISTSYRRLSTTNNKRGCVVTIDKVWEMDDRLLKSTKQLKDVCFSFALFKMLRCHFARYNVSQAPGFIKARDFLWHVLLEDSDGTRTLEVGTRTLEVIATELSFLQEYYYSSLPTTYSKDWLPISSIFISLLSIVYCIVNGTMFVVIQSDLRGNQIRCEVSIKYNQGRPEIVEFGNLMYGVIPLLLVSALAVLSEVRDIALYVFSDWTKVALVCRYISWREYPTWRKCIGILLRPRCKMVRPWKDCMNQCSIIVLHRRKFRPVDLLRRIIPLPEPKKRVKVPGEVKATIVATLTRSSRGVILRNGKMRLEHLGIPVVLRNGKTCLQQLGIPVGDSFLVRACGAQGTSDTMLSWHIATTIFEARNPPSLASSLSGSVAMHLSRYCAYLVAYSPELLPDNDKWSKVLYKDTKKGAERALRNAVPELNYWQLVERLSDTESKHWVLKEGARLGEQLVELMEGEEEAGWKALDHFWCEMILYLAHSSDNLDGHAVAVARGGELITLLWALLTHVGIPEGTAGSSTATAKVGDSPNMIELIQRA